MAALGSAVRARLILPAFRIWTAQHIFPALVHYCDLPSLPPGVGYGWEHQRLQVVFHAAVVFGGNVYTLARL